jgi:hypothetical protein
VLSGILLHLWPEFAVVRQTREIALINQRVTGVRFWACA